MRYEIDCVSRTGTTRKLAEAVRPLFPAAETRVVDLLTETPNGTADVYVLVFSFNKGTIPLKIMEHLDRLDGKVILSLVTFGGGDSPEFCRYIEQKLMPFLPDSCDYRGTYLCRGAFPETVIAEAQETLQENPDHLYARMVWENSRSSAGHPNGPDQERACTFVRKHLRL
ncbi:MAG: flavodoxin family protein [Candidatus Heritagella sp.]